MYDINVTLPLQIISKGFYRWYITLTITRFVDFSLCLVSRAGLNVSETGTIFVLRSKDGDYLPIWVR
jgi:hypothetical protein